MTSRILRGDLTGHLKKTSGAEEDVKRIQMKDSISCIHRDGCDRQYLWGALDASTHAIGSLLNISTGQHARQYYNVDMVDCD